MNTYAAKDIFPKLKSHGRIFFDETSGGVFFNWTCSGFTVTFTGAKLRMKLLAMSDRQPFPPDAPADYPCVGLVGEDGESLVWREKCAEGEAWYDVFSAGNNGPHTVRIVKLSENARGKTALLALETDGEILDADIPEKALAIEYVGDSITCGFGNEAPGQDSLFETSEENGWLTYGAICGRELDAEFNMISVSGISVSAPKYPLFPVKPMDQVYGYTDVLYGERVGAEARPWDFAAHKKDIVVLNLGTNDVNPLKFSQSLAVADEEEAYFCMRYRAFLENLRKLNGPETMIFCVLGPLDHYLYDHIQRVVAEYIADTGDERVRAFKLIGVNVMTEGFGAVGHPSLKTHERMGHELAERLRAIMGV